MTALDWDKVGERFFETGIDRGVLITSDGDAYAWNGLTNVTENSDRETKAYYMDGVKYLEHHRPGSYSAKLDAFTYPDILDELTGVMPYLPGVFLHDQRSKPFHVSYRTKIGNDVNQDLGYKLHIVYNVMAAPSGIAYDTIGENVAPGKFSWELTGTPPFIAGARPTSHLHLDSRFVNPELMTSIEEFVYGSATADPSLPDMNDLLIMISP